MIKSAIYLGQCVNITAKWKRWWEIGGIMLGEIVKPYKKMEQVQVNNDTNENL